MKFTMKTVYSLPLIAGLLLAVTQSPAEERVRVGAWQTAPVTNAPAKSVADKDGFRSFSGRVVETMDSGGYTYVLVETADEELWAATPRTAVKVGESVSVNDGMYMPNHHSRTLDRTFPVIYFAAGLHGESGTQPSLPAGHPPIGGTAAQLPSGHPPLTAETRPAPPKFDFSQIAKAPDGLRVEEVYANRAKFAGKDVVVRGVVVKYNAQIMGRNWLHLQDGTGKPGANDLTVTTTTPAKVGDVVLARGVLSTDKDFGAGYKFGVILDNAKVVVE